MLKVHRKLLLENRVHFVKDLEPNEIVNFLYQEKILTENDVELIKGEKTRKLRAELFLDTLPRKGQKAFQKFKESLEQNHGTKYLTELLDENSGKDAGDVVDSAKPLPERDTKRKKMNTDCYPMDHKPHGLCLIINNKEFLTNLSDRNGSDIDAKNLRELFSFFNFTTRVLNNASAEQMKEAVEDVARMNHSSTDCLVVCLLSHGISGMIYGSDGELLSVSNLLRPLLMCEDKPELANKPRLFFIQACRVSKTADSSSKGEDPNNKKFDSYEVVVHGPDASETTNDIIANEALKDSSELFIQETATPLQANVLMSYSTLPGEAAWRNMEIGSWFIDALVEVFKRYAAEEDVVTMLVRVNDAVSRRISSVSNARQIPAPVVTLTKKLYLRP